MFTLNQLEMFKLVADTGSFNKAAEEAYVTANAVMKQINNLENELGVGLFNRTFRGQQLTNAGEILYKRIQPLLLMCDDIVSEVKDIARHDINKIKVGVSIMTPLEPLNNLWDEIKARYPDIKIEIVTFENIATDERQVVVPIPGTKADFFLDAYDDVSLASVPGKGVELSKVRMHAIVSKDHRLAEKELIDIEELAGETVMRKKGLVGYIDEFCEELDRRNVAVNYQEVESYNANAYNECVEGKNVMLGAGNNRNFHPFLKRIPINWEKECSFGIIYSNNPSPAVRNFIGIVEEILSEKE